MLRKSTKTYRVTFSITNQACISTLISRAWLWACNSYLTTRYPNTCSRSQLRELSNKNGSTRYIMTRGTWRWPWRVIRDVVKFVRLDHHAGTTRNCQPTSSRFLKQKEKERYPNYLWECLVHNNLKTIRAIAIIKLMSKTKPVMISCNIKMRIRLINTNKHYHYLKWIKIMLLELYLSLNHHLVKSPLIAKRIRAFPTSIEVRVSLPAPDWMRVMTDFQIHKYFMHRIWNRSVMKLMTPRWSKLLEVACLNLSLR